MLFLRYEAEEEEGERSSDDKLTSSVDARRSNSGVIFSRAEDLVENLFLLFAKVHSSVVRPSSCCYRKRNSC